MKCLKSAQKAQTCRVLRITDRLPIRALHRQDSGVKVSKPECPNDLLSTPTTLVCLYRCPNNLPDHPYLYRFLLPNTVCRRSKTGRDRVVRGSYCESLICKLPSTNTPGSSPLCVPRVVRGWVASWLADWVRGACCPRKIPASCDSVLGSAGLSSRSNTNGSSPH
jgi:hypothetical protein